jgi:MFS family permease
MDSALALAKDCPVLRVGARLAQGIGAAMMSPAALSILTTFRGPDRHEALGVWAGISGLATAVGLLFGGLLTQNFGWRWVFFVNLPLCALVLFGAFRILKADRGRSAPGGFDAAGAVLVTASMLLLFFTLVKAPDEGWGVGRTIGGLAASAVLMAAFVVNERRAHPLVPLSIFRIKGLTAADATQVIAWAGFYSMFFFVTLYMQKLGSALGLAVFSGIATSRTSHLLAAHTRPRRHSPPGSSGPCSSAPSASWQPQPSHCAPPTPAANPPPHQKPNKTWNPPTTPHNTNDPA